MYDVEAERARFEAISHWDAIIAEHLAAKREAETKRRDGQGSEKAEEISK